MRYLLGELRIEGFRGINNEGDPLTVRLKPDAINSVFAPNGSGKSSLFDALCYALKGSIPKLDGLPSSERSEDYYANRFHSARLGRVEIQLMPEGGGPDVQIQIERQADGSRRITSSSGYQQPEALLATLAGEATFLDQRTFLKFVEDSPLGRGRSFAALVGLEKLSMTRQALEVLANTRTVKTDFEIDSLRSEREGLRKQQQRAASTLDAAYKQLTDNLLPAQVGLEEISKQVCARLKALPLLSPHIDCEEITRVGFDLLRSAIRSAEQSEKRTRLTTIISDIASLRAVAPQEDDLGDREALSHLLMLRDEALASTRGQLFQRLHTILAEVLQSADWANETLCPACLEEPGSPVRETVERVLQQYKDAEDHAELFRASWRDSPVRQQLELLEDLAQMDVPRAEKTWAKTDEKFSRGMPTLAEVAAVFDRVALLERSREAKLAALGQEKETIEASLPPSLVELTRAVEYAAQIAQALREQSATQSAGDKIERVLHRYESWQRFISDAKDTFARAEVALSTARVQQLEATFQPMYEKIMGHSEVKPRLLKAQGTEELYLRLESFFGHSDLSANTLLSESYRNALALSIFLSAALQATNGAGFLLLDDVTSSFDAGHQFNLMEVLRTSVGRPVNPLGPQVIILSHDGLLQKYFDSMAEEGGWYHQRLKGMAPRGMVFVEGVDSGRVRRAAEEHLQRGELDTGAQLVRQYLEHRLLHLIQKVQIPVPVDFAIRDDRKMVSNALDAIRRAIDLHDAAGLLILTVAQTTTFRGVHVPSIIGNWVSHYETAALASFSSPMLMGVLDTVDRIAECFMYRCSCSGGIRLRYYKDLSKRACAC